MFHIRVGRDRTQEEERKVSLRMHKYTFIGINNCQENFKKLFLWFVNVILNKKINGYTES